MEQVQGRLVYRRSLSKKLVFYDLAVEESRNGIEVMIKEGDCWTVQEIKDMRDSLKLGDIVKVQGMLESNGHTLRAVKVVVDMPWKDANPSSQFKPYPLSALRVDPRDVSDSGDTPQLCKFWVNSGRCSKGSTCPYVHGQSEGIIKARVEWLALRRDQKQLLLADTEGIHAGDAHKKSARARVFCKWLVDKFGKEQLCSGSGVLDVAGGRGAIAFELRSTYGISAVIVDPRPQKLSRAQYKIIDNLGPGATLPIHIQAEFSPQLWREDSVEGSQLRKSSLVIGMHPDEATDSIVDFAIEMGKSFAVVPCCVFPRLFPHRVYVNSEGESERVVSHSQLIHHLTQKADAQMEYLQFEGMNQVVFRDVTRGR